MTEQEQTEAGQPREPEARDAEQLTDAQLDQLAGGRMTDPCEGGE
jgi:hypothetical protein